MALLVLLAAACERGGAGQRNAATAPAEFLAVAGDSTYWVTNGPEGLRMRSAPLFLTRWGGRLADVYVVDDGERFDGADFSTVRVYRRDLLRGDSTLVLADGEVPAMAARYEAAHPDARPHEDDEDAESEPEVVAEHSVGLVAVHGPFLTVDLRTTIDAPEGPRGESTHRETLRRRVLDLRSGRPVSLAALFGPGAPEQLAVAGRAAFQRALATLDTLPDDPADRADTDRGTAETGAAGEGDPERDGPGRARAALHTLRFDPTNFGLATIDGAPAVQFVARGQDRDGAVTLALPAVRVATAAPAWWTADVRPLLPAAAPDAARLLADLHPEQLVRLDRPPVDAELRRALRRAFDESRRGDAATTSVAWRRAR